MKTNNITNLKHTGSAPKPVETESRLLTLLFCLFHINVLLADWASDMQEMNEIDQTLYKVFFVLGLLIINSQFFLPLFILVNCRHEDDGHHYFLSKLSEEFFTLWDKLSYEFFKQRGKLSDEFFQWLDELDDLDRAALVDYTADGKGFIEMNGALRRGGYIPVGCQARIDAVCLAVSKLARFNRYGGTVYRSTWLPPKILNKLQPGKTFVDKAFVSTSLDKMVPLEFNFNIYFVITSKTGVDVSRYSEKRGEREILFRPGTKFLVKSVEHTEGKDYPVCTMEEVLDDGSDGFKHELRRSGRIAAKSAVCYKV